MANKITSVLDELCRKQGHIDQANRGAKATAICQYTAHSPDAVIHQNLHLI